ncbi:MAG TPA: sigma-E factor regulatory protein RseB domain-containing protein [Candidatus Baltobacteraceae bacterium]|nr:sigma-E factor regulatory protein RseB domain-containing protein [Candidatus Baltobacteraceae bacterium]
MKHIALLACCGALVAGLSCAGARSEEPADSLVYDAMAAPASISYAGTVQRVRIGNAGSEASVFSIEHRAPNQTVRRYTTPLAMSGDYVITRGVQTYSVDVKRRRVVVGKNDAVNDQIAIDNNYLLLRQNYRAVKRGAESLDGRDVIDVGLINKYTHRTTVIVKIDSETKLVLDKQQFAGDGSLIAETRFEAVRYGAAIPDGDFTVPPAYSSVSGPAFATPSDDPHAITANAGFAAREPKFLPEGFSPVEGSIVILRGVRTLHVLYSDGLRTVSLFENESSAAVNMGKLRPQATTIGGGPADYAESGPTTLLAWRDRSLHYALVGELELTELKRIAGSI